jgi:hypothetical protein
MRQRARVDEGGAGVSEAAIGNRGGVRTSLDSTKARTALSRRPISMTAPIMYSVH